jgi:hypothetical protein
MMEFALFNAIGRIILTALVVLKLSMFRDQANLAERLGMGLMGGGSFLTAPVVLLGRGQTPFDDWAGSILIWGGILLISGRTYRDWKHKRANDEQVRRSRAHLESRGKL